MSNNNIQLDNIIPLRTAGALPSSRTEDMLETALASDNIDAVKTELEHVWAHYQSLEFMLNATAQNSAAIDGSVKEILGDEGYATATPAELIEAATRVVAGPVLENAYLVAHHAGFGARVTDSTISSALRECYPQLDHTDPATQITTEEAEAFFAAMTAEDADTLGNE